jgi:hypothetical protein
VGEGGNIAELIITISVPLATSLEVRIRSGKFTNTHMPRYSPNAEHNGVEGNAYISAERKCTKREVNRHAPIEPDDISCRARRHRTQCTD